MAEFDFNQSERRGIPWALLLVALIAAGVAWVLLHPASRVRVQAISTAVIPAHTVFAPTEGMTQGATVDSLYVVQSLKIVNGLQTPLTPESFTLTMTDASGAVLEVQAARKDDIPTLRTSFPALEAVLGAPLYREADIAPGANATGSLAFDMRIAEETWQKRRSAVIKIGFYHQSPVTVELPKP